MSSKCGSISFQDKCKLMKEASSDNEKTIPHFVHTIYTKKYKNIYCKNFAYALILSSQNNIIECLPQKQREYFLKIVRKTVSSGIAGNSQL